MTIEDTGAAPAPAEETAPDLNLLLDPAPPAEPAEPVAETTAANAPEQPVQQQPGTPDKAMQKMQQDLAATQRMMATVLERLNNNQPITERQQEQLNAAPGKIAQLREKMAGEGFDLFESSGDLIEGVLEQGDEVEQLRQQVAAMQPIIEQVQETNTFNALADKYKGVDVRGVWNNALTEAEGYKQFGEAAYYKRADDLFHERAKNAAASIAAKAVQQKPGRTAPPSPTPITKGGAMTVSQPAPVGAKEPASVEEIHYQDYLKLVSDE